MHVRTGTQKQWNCLIIASWYFYVQLGVRRFFFFFFACKVAKPWLSDLSELSLIFIKPVTKSFRAYTGIFGSTYILEHEKFDFRSMCLTRISHAYDLWYDGELFFNVRLSLGTSSSSRSSIR